MSSQIKPCYICDDNIVCECSYINTLSRVPGGAVINGGGVSVKGSDIYTSEGVGDPRVVLSMKTVRGAAADDLVLWQNKVFAMGTNQSIEDGVILAFQARDVRGGKGEKAVSEVLMDNIASQYPPIFNDLLGDIPTYGSWMDLVKLAQRKPTLEKNVFQVMYNQLVDDEAAVKAATDATPRISLMAKWAPREGNKFSTLAGKFAKFITEKEGKGHLSTGLIRKQYRQRMANLNRAIKTTEVLECANQWDQIEPKHVPGRARMIKGAAYLNEVVVKDGMPNNHVLRHPDDAVRMTCRNNFQDFYTAAAAGKTTINGAQTLYPHQIVAKASGDDLSEDESNALNATWTEMVKRASAGGGLGSSIAMCDFSGSMQRSVTSDKPYWISKAFGLLIAAANSGAFKGKFMGFSTDPKWLTVDTSTPLTQQLASLHTENCQGLSTDFQKAMDQVLATLKDARVRPGEEPKNLIVITDMGFDAACASNQMSSHTGHSYPHVNKTAPWQTHVEMIRENFKRAGEDMWGTSESGGLGGWEPPRIVIWNVAASHTDDFHANAQQEGVVMLSGWSPSLFKMLCEEGPRAITPYDMLRSQLDDVRYEPVRQKVRSWLEGGWRGL